MMVLPFIEKNLIKAWLLRSSVT